MIFFRWIGKLFRSCSRAVCFLLPQGSQREEGSIGWYYEVLQNPESQPRYSLKLLGKLLDRMTKNLVDNFFSYVMVSANHFLRLIYAALMSRSCVNPDIFFESIVISMSFQFLSTISQAWDLLLNLSISVCLLGWCDFPFHREISFVSFEWHISCAVFFVWEASALWHFNNKVQLFCSEIGVILKM